MKTVPTTPLLQVTMVTLGECRRVEGVVDSMQCSSVCVCTSSYFPFGPCSTFTPTFLKFGKVTFFFFFFCKKSLRTMTGSVFHHYLHTSCHHHLISSHKFAPLSINVSATTRWKSQISEGRLRQSRHKPSWAPP